MDYIKELEDIIGGKLKIVNSIKEFNESDIIKIQKCLIEENRLVGLSLVKINDFISLIKYISNIKTFKILNLNYSKIQELPNEFSDLKNLKELYLSNNLIEKGFELISMLDNLEILDLNDSNIQELPKVFENLKNLKELYLSNNPIKIGLECLPNLPNLEKLDLKDCKLKKIPLKFGSFSKLKKLNLSNNSIKENLKVVANIGTLEELYLRGSYIEEIDENFKYMKKLKNLDLYDCPIEKGLEWIVLIDSLEYLDLGSCGISEIPENFNFLKKLKKLNLSNNPINKGLEFIKNLFLLEILYLDRSSIKEIPKSISSLSNLKKLDLKLNKDIRGLEWVCELDKLEHLNLCECNITKIPENIASLCNLKDLNLNLNPIEKNLDLLCELYNLITLSLENCSIEKIPENIYKLSKLEYLNLKKNNITDFSESILKLNLDINISNKNKDLSKGIFLNDNPIDNSLIDHINQKSISEYLKERSKILKVYTNHFDEQSKIINKITKPIDSNSTSNDYLDRNHISSAISSYIKMKKESISTIGIFSTWGNGKSSFIKNILEKLKEEPSDNEVEIIPIEIDAVFSDDCEKIWIIIYKKLIEELKKQINKITISSIISFLIFLIILSNINLNDTILSIYYSMFLSMFTYIWLGLGIEIINNQKQLKFLKILTLKLYDFFLEVAVYFKLFYKPTIIIIANLIMFFLVNIINPEKLGLNKFLIENKKLIPIVSLIFIFLDFTKKIVSVLNKESFISAYKHEEKLGFKSVIHEKINNVIEKIVDGKYRKILVIVDELDRANLDKINEIIESTHILLNNNNLMFLFSVNPRQIGKSLLIKEKKSLNNEIDIYKYGRNYIEKYMDIYVYLPFSKDYSTLLDNLIEEAFEKKNNTNFHRIDTESDGTESDGTESDGTESDGTESDGTESDSTESDGTESDGTESNGTESDALKNKDVKEIMKFEKYEKQEIKITINKITKYSNLTPRKVKTIITLSTLAVQIFSSKKLGSTRDERLSLMKFILINLGLLDFIDMSEILKYEGSTYYKFLEKVISKTEETTNYELVKDIDIDFVDSYGKEYLLLFAEELDFN